MYTKLADNLYLTTVDVPKVLDGNKQESANHIWIEDISGSTAPFIERLGQDMCAKVDQLSDGDYLTYAVFSSPGGEYRVVIKGAEVNAKNRPKFKRIITENSYATNRTCFSEVLTEVATIVPDLAALASRFNLMFFTDGYPVPDTDRERKAIEQAIRKISGQLNSVMLVGYGDFYNKELMATMAQTFGGLLLHSSALEHFSVEMDKFIAGGNQAGRVELEAPKNALLGLLITKQGVVVYEPDGGVFRIAPESDKLFILLSDLPLGNRLVLIDNPVVEDGVLASAMVMSQRLRADIATDLLSRLGDVRLTNQMANALTNAEYGQVEANIQEAVLQPALRFVGGKLPNCLPDPNRPCLLDVLEGLMADDGALFYPKAPEFKYIPIGRPVIYPDGTPKFEAEDKGYPLSGLVWNDERLNLSLRVRLTGKIKLGDGHEAVGLAEYFPTTAYRTYTIIRDGQLNVTALPISFASGVHQILPIDHVLQNGVYVLDLTSVPIVNRAIVDRMPSATDLCQLVWREIELQAEAKVYRSLLDELKVEEKLAEFLTPEQDKFLRRHGITKSGFSPIGKSAEATDFYDAVRFEIKVKGYSDLPSLNEVKKRQAGGKPPTKPGSLMLPIYLDWEQEVSQIYDNEQARRVLAKSLADVTVDIRRLRSIIQRAKFAVVLGKRWFPEFPTRDNCVLTVGGNEFTFEIEPIQVKI